MENNHPRTVTYCTKCDEELKPGRAVWLELNCMTGQYRAEGDPEFPEADSQGWFPFGSKCAKRALAEQVDTEARDQENRGRKVLEALQEMESAVECLDAAERLMDQAGEGMSADWVDTARRAVRSQLERLQERHIHGGQVRA